MCGQNWMAPRHLGTWPQHMHMAVSQHQRSKPRTRGAAKQRVHGNATRTPPPKPPPSTHPATRPAHLDVNPKPGRCWLATSPPSPPPPPAPPPTSHLDVACPGLVPRHDRVQHGGALGGGEHGVAQAQQAAGGDLVLQPGGALCRCQGTPGERTRSKGGAAVAVVKESDASAMCPHL